MKVKIDFLAARTPLLQCGNPGRKQNWCGIGKFQLSPVDTWKSWVL